MKRRITTLLCLFTALTITTLRLYAQEIGSPLNIPLFLSGNFGELRSDHFHSGLDFKTQGSIGHVVKSVKEGSIRRISVGPGGFGRAIYINHPDGTTTVYGHLDRFAPQIESAVRDSQYVKESFSVNLLFSDEELPVKQGETIAYSGNTGSSGGPHLHFEMRYTRSEKPFDPLPFFIQNMRDRTPPEIRGLIFIPQPGQGLVNGNRTKLINNVVKDNGGNYVLSKPVKAWGVIGIGVKAYDKMDGTTNIYGVKEIRLTVDDKLVFHSVIDDFSFDDTRYLNSFIDWKEWRDNRSFFMKSFIEPGNKLDVYHSQSNGLISIREPKNYQCEYELKDAFGNITSFKFTITGEEQIIPEDNREGIPFPYNRDNGYQGKGMTLNIPQGGLYTDIFINPDTFQTNLPVFAPVYTFGENITLHSSSPLTLTITNDSYSDKSKYGIVSVSGNRMGWMGGEYVSGSIRTRIRELGQFSVAIDTIPPVIAPQNRAKWTESKTISFKITDNLSGISYYKGTLDGAFALFEFDAKTNLLFCKYDASRMKQGKQTLTLVVRDGAGNESTVSYNVVL